MKKKGRFGRAIAIFITGASLIAFLGVLGAHAWLSHRFERSLPKDFFSLAVIGEPSHFYVYDFTDRQNRVGDAHELTSAGQGNCGGYVEIQALPKHVLDAFVSIEDKRFYEHRGVDWYRTLAAITNHLFGGQGRFGASTITQQLVKNMTGNSDLTVQRKIQEIFYALDLERRLDKSEILELYLNVIHFAEGCNGIEAAAEHYFGKSARDLTLAEAASLAAIINNPSYYNPIRHPQNNLARRNLILGELAKQGKLTQESLQVLSAQPLGIQETHAAPEHAVRSWYVDMAIEDVINDLVAKYKLGREAASDLVLRGGLRIDLAMQPSVQNVIEDYYENAVKTPITADGERAQSALIAIDSRTGDILGVAGAIGAKSGNRVQNFATQTKRPPGSAIKPISIYAPALEEGVINWASVYDDVPVNFGADQATPWPKNATGVYRGLTNVAYAVAHSTNTVAVRILEQLGLPMSFHYAKERFGLSSMVQGTVTDCDLAALALGQLNYGVTLRELTAAYTVFADGGVYHPYRSYYRVLAADGTVLLSNGDSSDIVLSEGNAAIMTKLLQGVVTNGTSSSITLSRLVECAGKTGTTQNDGDRWFVGYTPDVICGVWCGYEYPKPLEGRNICTDIWNAVMRSIYQEIGGRTQFSVPSSVTRASYCRDSGKLLTDACALDPRGERAEVGWFLLDHLPETACDRHVLCAYDAEHGGVSHGLCPKEHEKMVALIRIKRAFPKQILITDAQYAWNEPPVLCAPNPDPTKAYFDTQGGIFYGRSNVKAPFNASCPMHQVSEPAEESQPWKYLYPHFFKDEAA